MCPLCRSDRVRDFAVAHGRRYLDCDQCWLIHLERAARLPPAAELAHYETHRNDPADPGYRRFLGRLFEPLVERLANGAEGLDYGSGPGPTLSRMLTDEGYPMQLFDPFYAPDPGALDRSYDFVTCTETVEHFYQPGAEFARLSRLLRPGGWLAVMTELVDDRRSLEDWRYARDPTHVSFYRPATMTWIAERFGWSVEVPSPSVVFFRDGR